MGCGLSTQSEKAPPIRKPPQNEKSIRADVGQFRADDFSAAELKAISREASTLIQNDQKPISLPKLPNQTTIPTAIYDTQYAVLNIDAPPGDCFSGDLVGAPMPLHSAKLVSHIAFER